MVTDEVQCGCEGNVSSVNVSHTEVRTKAAANDTRMLHLQLTVNILQLAETHSRHISYLVHDRKKEREKSLLRNKITN